MSFKLKKLHHLFILWIFSVSVGYGQVLNPSFEQGTIPDNKSQLERATYWTHYLGDCMQKIEGNVNTYPSSDLFDRRTSNSIIGVPNNGWTTPAGLNERTGQNRYAGIWSQASSTNPTPQDERIRGSLTGFMQTGSYNLSLYLARGKNAFAGSSNPNYDPTSKYQIEILLRQGNNDCSIGKLIYTTPSITNFQWQQYTTIFTVTSQEAGIYDKIEIRLKNYSYAEFGAPNVRTVFIDDVSISPVVCNLNPAYSYTVNCEKQSNQAVIDVVANAVNQYSQWILYQMNGNSTADQDINPAFTPIILSGQQAQFRVPNVAGTYYMIKHGVWTDYCGWAEQRRVFQIPTFSNYVNSDFSSNYIINSSGLSLSVSANDPTNPYSRWMLFQSLTSIPTTSSSWNPASSVITGNSHTFTNLQYNMYYMVRHVAKHNCSDYGRTDRIFYMSPTGKSNIVLETYTENISLEEIEKMEKAFSLQNATQDGDIKIYPNPAKEQVSISGSENSKVLITNQYGKVVYENNLSGELMINIANWKKGIYFVNIHTSERKTVKKLIVE